MSDIQMNASTLEVMRTPERRTSSTSLGATATTVMSPPDASKQKVMRRPSLRTTAMDQTISTDTHQSAHIRRDSSSSDSLVV